MASSRNTFSHFGHKSAGHGTLDWWRWLWERTGLVDVTCVEAFPDGWALWLLWKKARKAADDTSPGLVSDIQVLEADQGQYMGFIRLIASRKKKNIGI